MHACLGERAWRAAGARGLGREGPKDSPCLRLAQKEHKCLEIVCKWRRNHKSRTAKEGTRAWGCWSQGGRKGRAARGMAGGRAANGWLYGNCELVVETPGWMETGFERQGYSWRRTRWCGERETGIHDHWPQKLYFCRPAPSWALHKHSAGLPLAQHHRISLLCLPLAAGLSVECQLACPGWTAASMRGG